jgi:neurofibromin 1
VDLGEILFILAQYVHRLGRDDVACRIKIKYCQLCESVLQKNDGVTISNNSRFRNAVLEWSLEWSIDGLRVCRAMKEELG